MSDDSEDARHTALLVEDDAMMAKEVCELLDTLGYNVIHRSNMKDAKRAVDEGGFCFVLLDLQIPNSSSAISARVEAGHALLEHLRMRYPGRAQPNHDYLQVIVVSGHAKEHAEVIRSMQLGANDLVTKPLSENPRRLGDHISDALQRSKRSTHSRCLPMTQKAEAAGKEDVSRLLTLPVELHGPKTGVKIGDYVTGLNDAPLRILMKLMCARFKTAGGWIHASDLGTPNSVSKQLGRTATDMDMQNSELYENDAHGHYRLHPNILLGKIDISPLLNHSKLEIRDLAQELQELQELLS